MTGREQLAQPPRSSMRSDAEQNRARILAVARAALAESGEATLSSIAKLAGVGQGTMYRHFPTREVLLLAVDRQDVDADEVLLLVGFLWRIDNTDWELRSRHLLDLVMDSLRPQPG